MSAEDPKPDLQSEPCDIRLLTDTALVVEALAAFAGHPGDLQTSRQRRAWELISGLADDLGMTPSEVLRIDAQLEQRYP